jgi:hypothetical protein
MTPWEWLFSSFSAVSLVSPVVSLTSVAHGIKRNKGFQFHLRMDPVIWIAAIYDLNAASKTMLLSDKFARKHEICQSRR